MERSRHAKSSQRASRGGSDADRGTPVLLRDRVTGELSHEQVFGESELTFLYHTPAGRFLTDHLLTRAFLHHIYAWYKRRPCGAEAIARFAKKHGLDVSEAERPLDAYRSLDELFARRLRPGSRPIDPDPDHLVAPVDCRALAFAPLAGGRIPVKGNSCTLDEILLDRALAARYFGGAVFVLRLAPADYHRFHFPARGTASAPRPVKGRLHSVHPIARAGNAPSLRNKRVITHIASERFGDLVQIEVGALTIGTIAQTFRPGPVEPGQEKGLFRYGASAVLLLTEPGRVEPDADLIANTRDGIETIVKMGTRIAAVAGRE